MADFVEGEKRLTEDLIRRSETAENHPYFDQQVAAAEVLADAALDAGGWVTPLGEPLTDPMLRNAIAGVVVGLLTQTNSSREQWMTTVYNEGMQHLKAIEEGTVTTIIGAVPTEEAGGDLAIDGLLLDDPVFDTADPDAASLRVFPPLGHPRPYRWRA